MSIVKGTFINRTANEVTAEFVDYIAMVNKAIAEGQDVPIDGEAYQNALVQYNETLNKGKTERLDVPDGYCGYIDPESGEFRVEPIPDENFKKTGQTVPTGVGEGILEDVVPQEYPIDECLQHGLPGSFEYTDTPDCGNDDGDRDSSGISWVETGTESGTESLT